MDKYGRVKEGKCCEWGKVKSVCCGGYCWVCAWVGDVVFAFAKAEGEARALKIKADSESYYNKIVSASLSDKLIQQYYIEKWNGSVPQYQGGGQSYPIIKMN